MSSRFVYRVLIVVSLLSLLLAGCQAPPPQSANPQPEAPVESPKAAEPEATEAMSTIVMLPNGFQPEGVTVGRGDTAFVGSVGSGAIYKINLLTGEGSVFVAPQETQRVAGLAYDRRTDLLYVAGAESGNALVYDGLTGQLAANVQFTTDPKGFVNDVALANDVVYFTDSSLPHVYQLPLAPESHLPDPSASRTISLTGDFEYLPEGLNGNGIVASDDGTKLIVAHTDLGKLYVVDAATGETTELVLDGEVEIYHDGLVLAGDTLYVVNYNDKVYVVELDPEWTSGKLVRTLTDPKLEAPSTAAIHGDALYVVNARWDAEQTPETEFWLTQVRR
ncbi:MAG: superoxide dismutase [Anaerolineales bacterium]|nr:superoxide dismutase [Anaerolineales bacterium]